MYQSYFGLDSAPFSIVPDHRVVYMSKSHREAVAHLLYSLEQSGGFVQLTGEVGTGKTTVSRYLLQHLPENVDVALLLNPRISEKELLETICDELRIPYPSSATLKQLLDKLNEYLLAFHAIGRHTVLIIDEAQNLSREVLEQVRLLTNLETSTDKLLQIILIGQPELVTLLGRHDLRQLSQRIIGRFSLNPLTISETKEYIIYRLRQAGCERQLFTARAVRLVHKISGGIPRIINVLCDTALMGAYSRDESMVSSRAIKAAAVEILPGSPQRRKKNSWVLKTLIALGLIVAAGGALWATGTGKRWMDQLASITNAESVSGTVDNTIAKLDQSTKLSQPLTASVDTGSVQTPSAVAAMLTNKAEELELTAANDAANANQQATTNSVTNENDKPVSKSRFDLVYRLGVPFRSN